MGERSQAITGFVFNLHKGFAMNLRPVTDSGGFPQACRLTSYQTKKVFCKPQLR